MRTELCLDFLLNRASSIALLLMFTAALLLDPAACAQVADQVHVGPSPDLPPSTASVAKSDRNLRIKPLQVDVDLVLVPVTVTDTFSRPVIGLNKDNFKLFEGGREQQIRFFSSEDAPLSVGLVLDVSKSMAAKISTEREALAEFFKNANPQDDYFAVAVSDRPIVLAEATRGISGIQAKLASIQPTGYTALMDSIYLVLNKMRSARHPRRVILIISDGGENDSRYKSREIKELAEESGVLIYAIRPYNALPFFRTIEEKLGNRTLSGITEATGGRTVSLADSDNLPGAAAAISRELRNQYVLGYHPTASLADGKWHKIEVRMARPVGDERLQAHYKRGYSAPNRP